MPTCNLAAFLNLVAEAQASRRLLGEYDAALAVADHAREQEFALTEALRDKVSRFVQRLADRRRTLKALLGEPAARR